MPASEPKRVASASEAGTAQAFAAVSTAAVASPARALGAAPPSARTRTEAANTTRFAANTSASA